MAKIDHRENRRERRRLCFPGQGQPENPESDIETAFNAPVLPLSRWDSGIAKAHGRLERRTIGVLPAKAAAGIGGEAGGAPTLPREALAPTQGERKWQEPQVKIVYLIASLAACEASPQAILQINRGHWGLEVMPRNKDVIPRPGRLHEPVRQRANIFSLTGFVLTTLKSDPRRPERWNT